MEKTDGNNLFRSQSRLSPAERARRLDQTPCVVWFTGLSGAGKTTLAVALELALHQQERVAYLLDGDNLRFGLNKDLGFSAGDRMENIRRAGEVAALMLDAGLIVLAAFISPFRQDRDMIKALVSAENFIEVYVSTPLSVCEQRDVKGLYKKAREGLIKDFTGVDSAYEEPSTPSLCIDTSVGSVEEHVARIMAYLRARGVLA